MRFHYSSGNFDRLLFYPCSGADWSNLVYLYSEKIDTFVFSDLHYRFNAADIRKLRIGLGPDWIADDSSISVLGATSSECKTLFDEKGRVYRWIEPGWLEITFSNSATNRTIKVVWRRGFGEYALQEFPENSIDIFCHRGDSDGEGGSASYFFADRKKRHRPLSKLFSTLKTRLKDDVKLISDGSNTSFSHLRQAAKGLLQLDSIVRNNGLRWTLVAELPWHKAHQYGKCYEWRVHKIK